MQLTGREYFLLNILIEANGEVVTRKMLITKIRSALPLRLLRYWCE